MQEKMTKERLLAYRSNKQEIRELEFKLNNRWMEDTMIGNDVIFDYSKGYPIPQSVVGFDQKKYERLQERDLNKKEALEKECAAVESYVESIEDGVTRRIFRMSFLEGKKQKDVSKEMNMERSTISKKISVFLKVSHKSQKSHL